MIVIEKEAFNADRAAEILPLSQKGWNESTKFKDKSCAYYGERDFQIEPDTETYLRLADEGKLALVTLRDDGELKGYVIGFTYKSMHHKKIPCGFGDAIYIEPPYRSYTAVIAERFEKEMKELGAQIIGWPVHVKGPVYKILKAKGYVWDDVVMEKRLCV